MTKKTLKNKALTKKTAIAATLGVLTILGTTSASTIANAQIDMAKKPVLVITNKAMPSARQAPSAVYSTPARAREITPQEVTMSPYTEQSQTVVGQKAQGLNKELFALQSRVERLSTQLSSTETRGRSMAADYYSSVATINTQLQTGTTPGNPRLVNKLNTAQKNLETLSANIANLNSLSVEVADTASKASYLLDTVRSTYNLSGAIEEDHQRLAQLEDQINASIVNVSRLQSSVSDDITRTTAYLTSERSNLRTLALAVSNGDLYGQSLASQTFSPATLQQASFGGNSSMSAPMQKRLLAKIRFDRANVNFEQPVYAAVQSAMQKHPNSKFELVAVHPSTGNTAQVAIESTKARRNAEKVLRSLTQMGLSLDKIDLSYSPSNDANTNEVHVFVR